VGRYPPRARLSSGHPRQRDPHALRAHPVRPA
jgi:hypothetical protein